MEKQESHVISLFEILASKNPLLPNHLENLRLQTDIFDSLNVKGRPDLNLFNQFMPERCSDANEYKGFLEISKPFLLKTIDQGMDISLMDKLSPHALYELMLISTNPKLISCITEHEPKERKKIFQLFSIFPQFAKDLHLFPYIAFSYDPNTLDRESGQCEKRFHAHFIGRTKEELNTIAMGKKQLSELSYLRRRRLIDESSIIASMIFRDFLVNNLDLKSIFLEPEKNYLVPSLKFNLIHGWNTLNSINFDEDFQAIHNGLLSVFADLTFDFTDGKFGHWQRPNLDRANIKEKLDKYYWLLPESRETLEYFLEKLKPNLLKKVEYFRNPIYRDITTQVYPLNGLCYSTAFFEEDGLPKMLIRPQLFSDLGGAGVEQINGVTTKIKRNVGVFNDEEMKSRRRFQNLFIEEIT